MALWRWILSSWSFSESSCYILVLSRSSARYLLMACCRRSSSRFLRRIFSSYISLIFFLSSISSKVLVAIETEFRFRIARSFSFVGDIKIGNKSCLPFVRCLKEVWAPWKVAPPAIGELKASFGLNTIFLPMVSFKRGERPTLSMS